MNYDKLVEYYLERKRVAEKEIRELREQVTQKQITINGFEQLARKYCTHRETEVQTRWYEGDYYNRSVSARTVVCKACGYVLEQKDIVGGYA